MPETWHDMPFSFSEKEGMETEEEDSNNLCHNDLEHDLWLLARLSTALLIDAQWDKSDQSCHVTLEANDPVRYMRSNPNLLN